MTLDEFNLQTQRNTEKAIKDLKSSKSFLTILKSAGSLFVSLLFNILFFFVDLFLFIWQFPQNLIAVLFLIYLIINRKVLSASFPKLGVIYFYHAHTWGVSLGDFILVGTSCSEKTISHEYGHHLQSLIFGPFYLFFIGLPSFFRNIYHKIFHRNWNDSLKETWYYGGYPEKWADKLGKVQRNS